MRVARLLLAVVFAGTCSCQVIAITHLTDGIQDDINLRPSGKRHMRREMSPLSLQHAGEEPRRGSNKFMTESLLQTDHITIQGTLELQVLNTATFVNNHTLSAAVDGMADACAVEPDQVVLDSYANSSSGHIIFVFNITMPSNQVDEVKDSLREAATELGQIDDRMRSALNVPINDDSFSASRLWLNGETTTTTITTTTTTTTSPFQEDTGILGGHIDLRVPDVDNFLRMPEAVEAIKAALANVANIDETKVVTSNDTIDVLNTADVRFNFNLTVPVDSLQTISDSIENANMTEVEEQIEFMLANDDIEMDCTVRHLATKGSAVISPAVSRIKVVGSILIEADDVDQAKANLAVKQQLKSDLERMSGVGLQGNFSLRMELAPSLMQLMDDGDDDDNDSDGPASVMEDLTFKQEASVMNVSFECTVPSTFPGGAMAVVRKLESADQAGFQTRVQEVFTNEGLGDMRIIQITAELWFPPTATWFNNREILWAANHAQANHSTVHRIHHAVHHAGGALNMSDMTLVVGNMSFESDHVNLWSSNPHTQLALSMAIGYLCMIPVEEIKAAVFEDQTFALLQLHDSSVPANGPVVAPDALQVDPLPSEGNNGGSVRDLYIYKFKIDVPKMWAAATINLIKQVNETNLEPMFQECLSYTGITTIQFQFKGISVHEESLPMHHPNNTLEDETPELFSGGQP